MDVTLSVPPQNGSTHQQPALTSSWVGLEVPPKCEAIPQSPQFVGNVTHPVSPTHTRRTSLLMGELESTLVALPLSKASKCSQCDVWQALDVDLLSLICFHLTLDFLPASFFSAQHPPTVQ